MSGLRMPFPANNWSSATIPPLINYRASRTQELMDPGISDVARSPPEVVFSSNRLREQARLQGNGLLPKFENELGRGGKLHKKKGTKKNHKKGGSKSKKHHKKTRAHRSRHRRRH